MQDDLGDRMKNYYENTYKFKLLKRVPVIVRLDGKCFHNFCKRFKFPYDEYFNQAMNEVMIFLCSNIQGSKFAERHSDEISILLMDYDNINTGTCFDYNIQKMTSIFSSYASTCFCKLMFENSYIGLYENWPCFDCRCFNLPEHEIVNYFLWRKKDAVRNSINSLARSLFSTEDLQYKNNNEKQEMIFQKSKINWNNLPQYEKSGHVLIKNTEWNVEECSDNRDEIKKKIKLSLGEDYKDIYI